MITIQTKALRHAASAAVLVCALMGGQAMAQQTVRTSNVVPAVNLTGPKKSIAVIDVSVPGAFQAQYGSVSNGGGLAAMLETELGQSGQFRIAQRSHLDATLYEQQLGELGLNGARTAKAGQLTGAQYLVRAAVTDFTLAQSGGGLTVSGAFGGVLGGLSPQVREGRVGIDFQVIDSTSGEVIDSFKIARKLKSTSIALTATKNGRTASANSFANSPLGQAAREAMTEASMRIGRSLRDRSWTAQVAQVRGGQVYINVGADGGLKVGDGLRIHRVVERVTDPVTGALLGIERAEIGAAVISNVQGQYATATFQSAQAPQTGDIITMASR